MAGIYNTEILIGGTIFYTDQVPMEAGDYLRGQALAFDAGNGWYEPFVAGGGAMPVAIWLEEDRTVDENGDYGSVMVGGPFNERGLLDAAGDVIELTPALRLAARALGFYPRR